MLAASHGGRGVGGVTRAAVLWAGGERFHQMPIRPGRRWPWIHGSHRRCTRVHAHVQPKMRAVNGADRVVKTCVDSPSRPSHVYSCGRRLHLRGRWRGSASVAPAGHDMAPLRNSRISVPATHVPVCFRTSSTTSRTSRRRLFFHPNALESSSPSRSPSRVPFCSAASRGLAPPLLPALTS